MDAQFAQQRSLNAQLAQRKRRILQKPSPESIHQFNLVLDYLRDPHVYESNRSKILHTYNFQNLSNTIPEGTQEAQRVSDRHKILIDLLNLAFQYGDIELLTYLLGHELLNRQIRKRTTNLLGDFLKPVVHKGVPIQRKQALVRFLLDYGADVNGPLTSPYLYSRRRQERQDPPSINDLLLGHVHHVRRRRGSDPKEAKDIVNKVLGRQPVVTQQADDLQRATKGGSQQGSQATKGGSRQDAKRPRFQQLQKR